MTPLRFNLLTRAFDDFWLYENGLLMLNRIKEVPSVERARESIPLLFQKDDVADQVIADYFIDRPFSEALFQVLGSNSDDEASLPSLKQLIQAMHELPDWVNPELLDLGRRICNRSGKSGLIVLRNYSLMLGYQSAAINKPLIATGALHSGAVKRIADTTAFWYAVTGTDALKPGNEGFTACLRTRIVHAYSRVMIKSKLDWAINEQGEPLNYWDMMATYLGFSLVFIDGLRLLGMSIDDREADAVFHLWKYVGHLIGIPHHLMPDHEQQAIEQLYLWSKTQPEADADSIALAQALHQEPLLAPWPPRLWQKKIIQQVNLAFNRHLIGERSCRVLQLPAPKFPSLVNLVIAANKADDAIARTSPNWRFRQEKRGRSEQKIIRDRVLGH